MHQYCIIYSPKINLQLIIGTYYIKKYVSWDNLICIYYFIFIANASIQKALHQFTILEFNASTHDAYQITGNIYQLQISHIHLRLNHITANMLLWAESWMYVRRRIWIYIFETCLGMLIFAYVHNPQILTKYIWYIQKLEKIMLRNHTNTTIHLNQLWYISKMHNRVYNA